MQAKLNDSERRGIIANRLRPHLNKDNMDFERETRDAFDPRSGHRTENLQTFTVIICGVDAADVEKIKQLLGE